MGNKSLSLEGVLNENSILAFRAGGKQGDRASDQFLDPADIFNGLGRQVRPGTGVGGRFLPAFDGLIDWNHTGLGALAGRQMVDLLAVQHVAGADLDTVEAVEDIELGQSKTGDAAGADGLAHQHGIEPAAAPLAPGVDAEFLAAATDLLTDLVVQFGRERALADPRRIGLADA